MTYVSTELDDLTALTPSELIFGRRISALPNVIEKPDEIDFQHSTITRRQRHLADILQKFWRRWQTEYMHALRERHSLSQHFQSSHSSDSAKLGDIVLIHDDSPSPRMHWKRGKIIALHTGSDKNCRSALLKTQNGQITRPLAKLYPLETSEISDNKNEISDNKITVPIPTIKKSERAASQAAKAKIKDLFSDANESD